MIPSPEDKDLKQRIVELEEECRHAQTSLNAARLKLEALWGIPSLNEGDMEQVCNGILRAIVSMSGSDCGFYGLVDEERSAMTVYTWPIKGKKKDGSAACPRRFSVSAEGIWGAAIQHREPVVLNDGRTLSAVDMELFEDPGPLLRLLVVPHCIREKVTAVAALANRGTDYGQDDVYQITAFLNCVQAVVESKQMEIALRIGEEKYRSLFDHSRDAMLLTEPNGVVLEANPAACRMFGRTSEEMQRLGRNGLVDTTDARLQLALIERERTGSASAEITMLRADGERFPAEVTSTIFVDAGGRRKSSVMIRDITDRKRVEESNRQNEARLEGLLRIARYQAQSIQDLLDYALDEAVRLTDSRIGYIYFYDDEKREFHLNTWSKEVMLECSIPDPPTVYPLEKTGIWGEAVRQEGPVVVNDFQAFHPLKKGYPEGHAPLYKFLTVPVFSNGRIVAVAGVANKQTDYDASDVRQLTLLMDSVWRITEEKKAQETLREREERFRKLSLHVPGMIFQFMRRPDGNYCLPFSTEAIDSIFGCSPEGVREDFAPIVRAILPEDLGRVMGTIEASADRLSLWRCEFRVQVPGRPIRWILGQSTPERLPDGSMIWHGFATDTTEAKQAEEERTRLQQRLQQAGKLEALGTLAGGVAHDLNNILGVLVGYSELMLEKAPVDSPLRRYADQILQSGMRGAAIIQDLLTLARRGVTVSEVIDLNKVVRDCFQTPEWENLKLGSPGVRIRTNLEEGLLPVKGSPVHLGKALMNLVSNAAESIAGDGEVSIQTRNRYLDEPIRGYGEIREGEYVVLTVSDTGSGISSVDLAKIFEPFYTKKTMGRSGTGLGLTVVWGTVKDHDGYMDVQSDEGKGTVFSVYLPATREVLAGSEEPLSIDGYLGKGEFILVVDDAPAQRELARSMLERLGYKVDVVGSGEEAVVYLQRRKVDLVVLDMIMGAGMDGMETYRRLAEIRPGQKAVIVSGFSETDRVAGAQAMGAGAFVRKPYLSEKIGLAVRRELDRS